MADGIVLGLTALTFALFAYRRWHRLNNAPAWRPRLDVPYGFLLAMGTIACGVIGAAAAHGLMNIDIPSDDSPPQFTVEEMAKLSMAMYAAQGVAVGVYFWFRARTNPASAAAPVDARHPWWRAASIGVIGVLLIWPVMQTVAMIASWMLGGELNPIAHDTLRLLNESAIDQWFIVLVVAVTVAAPIVEEVIYRGLVQDGIVRAGWPRWSAIALASIVFALMHIDGVEPHGIAALFVFSLGLGWLYEKTGRLTAPIVMHSLFNAGNFLLARVTS